MLKIAVCDDESNERQSLVTMITKALNLKNKQHQIFEFASGEELLSLSENFYMYFLDIKMGTVNGIEAAKKIRLINEKAIIVFITGFKDYVFEAFDVHAFHYILKPVDENKLKEILYSALSQIHKKNKFIIAKTLSQTTKILIKDILYIESSQRKLKVHTNHDIMEYYHKLSDIEKELSGCNFFRCHKSYIVNFMYIESFDNVFITLKNSEKIYISKYKLTDFSKAFMYYLKKEEY